MIMIDGEAPLVTLRIAVDISSIYRYIPYCKDRYLSSKQCFLAGNEAPGGLCTGAGPVKGNYEDDCDDYNDDYDDDYEAPGGLCTGADPGKGDYDGDDDDDG